MKNWFLNELSCKCHLTLRPSTRRGKQQTNLIIPKKLCHRSRSIKFSVYSAFPPTLSAGMFSAPFADNNSLKWSLFIIIKTEVHQQTSVSWRRARWKEGKMKISWRCVCQRLTCRCREKSSQWKWSKRFRNPIDALSTSTSAQSQQWRRNVFVVMLFVYPWQILESQTTYGIFYLWKFSVDVKAHWQVFEAWGGWLASRVATRLLFVMRWHEISAINCLKGVSIDRALWWTLPALERG